MNYCVCPYRPWQIIVIEKCAHYCLDESNPWMLKLVLILIRFLFFCFPMAYELCIFLDTAGTSTVPFYILCFTSGLPNKPLEKLNLIFLLYVHLSNWLFFFFFLLN